MDDATDLACAALPCGEAARLFADVPLCRRHYRWLKAEMTGQPIQAVLDMLPVPLIEVQAGTLERFASKIRISDEDACRLRWTGALRTGYGVFQLNGKKVGAHVASHLMFAGPVPDGWHVDHVRKRGCTHRDCVWWPHLEAVTPRENWRRGDSGKWQRDKTHCKWGHEFTPENTLSYGPEGQHRKCLQCVRDRTQAHYWKDGREPVRGPKKTHCRYGHEFTPENTYTADSGARRCRQCALDASVRRRAKQRQGRGGLGVAGAPGGESGCLPGLEAFGSAPASGQ